MKEKKKPKSNRLTFVEAIGRLKKAGLTAQQIKPDANDIDAIEKLGERIEKILSLVKQLKNSATKMIFFIMYDIENNKVRTHIAKYLIKSGCVRIQKSVYLAQLDRKKYNEIHTTLKEVQEIYFNDDSILFVPVSTDTLTSMKIIGEQLSFDLILESKNTLFF